MTNTIKKDHNEGPRVCHLSASLLVGKGGRYTIQVPHIPSLQVSTVGGDIN